VSHSKLRGPRAPPSGTRARSRGTSERSGIRTTIAARSVRDGRAWVVNGRSRQVSFLDLLLLCAGTRASTRCSRSKAVGRRIWSRRRRYRGGSPASSEKPCASGCRALDHPAFRLGRREPDTLLTARHVVVTIPPP
jgi:hypothetical protein